MHFTKNNSEETGNKKLIQIKTNLILGHTIILI